MIRYAGLTLSVEDAITIHAAEWTVNRRVPFWRFDPTDAEVVWVQVYAHMIDAIPPPSPLTPFVSYFTAAGAELIEGYEQYHAKAGTRPPPEPIEWGWNGDVPVVTFRRESTPPWPSTLTDQEVTQQHQALRAWLQQQQPWTLPDAFAAAWRPLMLQLAREEGRRRERRARPPRERDTRDLVEIVGETVELTKRGGRWIGMCPLHEDRTPSLSVHPEKGWYCFGCGSGGKAGTWLQKVRGR